MPRAVKSLKPSNEVIDVIEKIRKKCLELKLDCDYSAVDLFAYLRKLEQNAIK
jgi:hypothetical protein